MGPVSDRLDMEGDGGWVELELEDAVGALGADADGDRAHALLALLLAEPSTRAFLRVEAAASADEARLEYLVPGTRIFVNRGQLVDVRGDVLAAVAVWVLSQSLTWSAGVALFQKLTRTVRRLSPQELSVLKLILALAEGDRPVATEAIAARFHGKREDLDRELACLSRGGVIWPEGAGWRVAK